jgi:hypothetical protein
MSFLLLPLEEPHDLLLFITTPLATMLNYAGDHDMTLRSIAAALLAFVLFALPGAERCLCAPMQQQDSPPDFRQLLQKLANAQPDPCDESGEETEKPDIESELFQKAEGIIADALNASPADSALPQQRAENALKKLEQMSAEINAAWPAKNRFHFEMLDLPPIFIVKMTLRTHDRFFVFGIPEKGDEGKPNRLWQEVGSDVESFDRDIPMSQVSLYPLHRGTSGNARFLATSMSGGCAGNSLGVTYDAREWNPKDIASGGFEQVIKQSGAWGLDDDEHPGFKLRTEGSLITLPYCWHSAIDTWDYPSLCAADTYDISGDIVKFRSRAYNRPDILPVAKVIEYAQKRDYPAVLGYCASSGVAHRLVRDVPPFIFSDSHLQVTHTGKGKERVELGDEPTYLFDVEKRAGRWRVVAFSTK